MKKIAIVVLFLVVTLANAQTVTGEFTLEKNVSIRWVSEKFIASKHKIETCGDKNDKFICKIDGNLWYGSDQGLELPRNQLMKLEISINGKPVQLEVKSMFNASFDGNLSKNQFRLQREGSEFRLYSYFSDGAGTYTVHWRILGDRSIRELISTDEKYFGWQ